MITKRSEQRANDQGATLLLMISLSAIRLAAGSPECSPYKPICAALPTTFDYVLFGGALVVAFVTAAFYFGYTRSIMLQKKNVIHGLGRDAEFQRKIK